MQTESNVSYVQLTISVLHYTSNQKDCILSDDIAIIMILEYRYVYHELLYIYYGKKDHGKVSEYALDYTLYTYLAAYVRT